MMKEDFNIKDKKKTDNDELGIPFSGGIVYMVLKAKMKRFLMMITLE